MNSEIRNSKFETNSNSQCSHGRNFARSRFEHSDFGFLDQKSSPHAGRIARSRSSIRQDSGFTLVELMVVVMIISILATYITVAMYGAMERARITRTQTQITRIEMVISNLYHQYMSRRIPIKIPHGVEPTIAAEMRLDAMRDLMRLELPDRVSDVTEDPVVNSYGGYGTVQIKGIPSRTLAYRRRVAAANGEEWEKLFNQGAECLYMILAATRDGNSTAISWFNESEIGDVDGDGMKEILDAWGRPIQFIRWPTAHRSSRQDGDAINNPDHFNPHRVHAGVNSSFAIYPLIYSAGPDGEWDVRSDNPNSPKLNYTTLTPKNDPYFTGCELGREDKTVSGLDDTVEHWWDNITNHKASTRSGP